ncbi:AAA family ATPase [Nitrospira sp. BLG_1]|uniref:AAA family ATPase n=1 Tax=Nitrospira sp. BLG_1 TaxID=3395883 RepID=UPI0039BC3471
MRLRYLAIPKFRNLRNLTMDFCTQLPSEEGGAENLAGKPIRSHALIGQNATGKSNLIEALITIFRDIDLNREAAFDYTLEYEIRGHIVRIQAEKAKQKHPFVWVDDDRVSQEYLTKNDPLNKVDQDKRRGPRLLPTHIFAYYSGRNERIESLFQEHQRRFNRRQEITAEEKLSEEALAGLYQQGEFDAEAAARLRAGIEGRTKRAGDDRLRRLFYCRGGHSQLVLLACLLSDDQVFQKVLRNLHIESLESALFVLKEPYRLRERRRSGTFDENELNEGDPRFWYARGNVVSEFLDKLWQVAWAPIQEERTKQLDFRGRSEKQKQLYLFVPSQEKLKKLGDLVGSVDSFFRYAEGAYIGDLIDEVRITVRKRDENGGKVSFTQLSEGELQMLTVLGLMRITREDHCLFLLDEPDTHLNPIWKLRYFDDIEGVLGSGGDSIAHGESQVLITTHDPMMIGSLRREQVHILRTEGGKSVVEIPDEHPQGMGVAGLLKSEMFGLPSTLDAPTLRELQERNELLAKKAKQGLTEAEESRLAHLRKHLEDLGFSREYRDPLYQLFIQKMYEARSQPLNKLFTEDELREQEALAKAIVTKLVKQDRQSDLSALAQELKIQLGRNKT